MYGGRIQQKERTVAKATLAVLKHLSALMHADDSRAGPSSRSAAHPSSHPPPPASPPHLALRGWLQGLSWPELGYSHTLHSVLESLEKLENPSASLKKKAPARKRARKATAAPDTEGLEDSLEDSDSEAHEGADDEATPGKQPTRSSTRARARAGVGVGKKKVGEASRGVAADDSAEASEGVEVQKKRPPSVASRFARRKAGGAVKLNAAKTSEREPVAADVEMTDVVVPEASVCSLFPSWLSPPLYILILSLKVLLGNQSVSQNQAVYNSRRACAIVMHLNN